MYQLSWLIPDRVIQIHLEGDLQMEMLCEMADTLLIMLDERSGDREIHLLFDANHKQQIDKRFLELQTITRNFNKLLSHPQLGWIVVYDEKPHPLVGIISGMLISLFNGSFKILGSMDACVDFLHNADRTLISSPAPVYVHTAISNQSSQTL